VPFGRLLLAVTRRTDQAPEPAEVMKHNRPT
jgi:hypothetical protein